MVGSVNGFIALCEKDDDFPDFLKYHCIIHQQVLCSKRLITKDVTILHSKLQIQLERNLFDVVFSDKNSRDKSFYYTLTYYGSVAANLFKGSEIYCIARNQSFLQTRGDTIPSEMI